LNCVYRRTDIYFLGSIKHYFWI